MRRIDKDHLLILDINTDKSHLVAMLDENQTPILTFDNAMYCKDAQGNIIGHVTMHKNSWIAENSLGIEVEPVSCIKVEGNFDVEAQFCKKWLELQQKSQ